MKKNYFLLALFVILFSSCSTTSTLYDWGGNTNGTTAYENATYQSYKQQTPESICAMLCVYEQMVTHPGGSRQVPPPGVCAEYAYYLTLPETSDAWSSVSTAKQKRILQRTDFESYAKELFEKEMTLYPESIVFIQPLMEKLLAQ